ncbi:hypothetical protein VKT23_012104 [Stygiomarasmius scandens]|uniref:Uncharacterized protein n=1 Tax=Marasmiellus scandens TaxID=2682957 RepID=A0ABR1JCE7_9AGAR
MKFFSTLLATLLVSLAIGVTTTSAAIVPEDAADSEIINAGPQAAAVLKAE